MVCQIINGQAPLAFNYQAVARNANGSLIQNQLIGLRFSVLDTSPTGNILYQESDTTRTNPFGLFSTQIGKGEILQGAFSSIKWGSSNKFLRVEIDISGNSSYIDMGTTQLISVPYALYDDSAGKIERQNLSLLNDSLKLSDGGSVYLGKYRDTFPFQTLVLHNDTLSLSHANKVVLPYNSMTNFAVRINGKLINDSSVNDVKIQPYQFLTEKDYKYEFKYVTNLDTANLTGSNYFFTHQMLAALLLFILR